MQVCRLVEDREDVKAATKAKLEEERDQLEFEDEGSREQILKQIDPLSKVCLDLFLQENPAQVVEEAKDIEICSESSDSESEAFRVTQVDNPKDIFANFMEFLKSKYIVY